MKLNRDHQFIPLSICMFIHAIFFDNLKCNVYFITSYKYNIVPALQKAAVYRGIQKHEPTILT